MVRTLQHYLAITAPLRLDSSKLFITTTPPFRPASQQTLSRWIRAVLSESGIDSSFTPHSTRHSATSAAQRGGAAIDSILTAAGWTPSSHVFARFYNRPLAPNRAAFANAASGLRPI